MKNSCFIPHLNFICAPEKLKTKQSEKSVFSYVYNKALPKKPKKATAYITAVGIFELYINGKKVSDEYFAPCWTSEKRLMVCRYNATKFFKAGNNEICVYLANGFALGDISSHHERENGKIHFADNTSVAANFAFEFDSGKSGETLKDELLTDESWKIYSTPITFADIYQGEKHDYTKAPEFLSTAVFDKAEKPALIKFYGGSVRPRERFKPVRLIISPKGEKILDFGQNLAGFAEIKNVFSFGDEIKLSHGEILDKNGNFYNGNLQWAKAETEFISDGKTAVLAPRFSYQGFRYVRLDEFPEENPEKIDISIFSAVALYTDMESTLTFESSNPLLNRFFKNVLWGQKSNFLRVPTDCPQRSERFGWTGDVQVFCKTAFKTFNVKNYFSRWLKDVYLDRVKSGEFFGGVPSVVPAVFGGLVSAGWGDVATVCPWELYLAYGDKKQLKSDYPLMKSWVEYIRARAKKGGDEYMWTGDEHYGDWLAMDIAGELLGCTQTDLIAQAYYYKSALLCAKAARVLNLNDYKKYDELAKSVKEKFINSYLSNGKTKVFKKGDGDENAPHGGVYARPVSNDTQTALSLILTFGLCSESDRPILSKRLYELVKENGHLTTGFLGTPALLYALSENGYEDAAYDLLLSEKMPSWLFPVTKGATTVWERWNGIDENGNLENPDMNSFNHYAYGAVFSWVIEYALGIKTTESGAGYKEIIINPHPNENLNELKAVLKTPQGEIKVCFKTENGKTNYDIEVPPSSSATVILKGKSPVKLGGESGKTTLKITV